MGCLHLSHRKARPTPPLRLGSGALLWRALDLDGITREVLGHHVEACFSARFPELGTGREAPGALKFISKAVEEIQEARVLQGDRRPPSGAAPCLGEGKEFRVCIDIPGLNRASSRQLF